MEKDERKVDLLPLEYQFNLSDFALFLSVMKNKRAYECTLSIILEEEIELENVKVEQVILNQSGKETKYRELPSTVIIFITQEDIFKKDLAKYTFTEQCEEFPGFHLGDGTTKIFLNMTSKNGSKELVSLLQYMKETDLNNPEILVKDKRILELDKIVTEVKESEEWEAVEMNIFEIGIERGKQEIIKEKIQKKLAKGKTVSEIAEALEEEEIVIESLIEELKREC